MVILVDDAGKYIYLASTLTAPHRLFLLTVINAPLVVRLPFAPLLLIMPSASLSAFAVILASASLGVAHQCMYPIFISSCSIPYLLP